MLSSNNRLTKKIDFDRVKQAGKLIHSQSFAFAFLPTNAEKPSRFGFVVSTKISKKAVERNRAKRQLREAVRACVKNTRNGFDCVFLTKQSILSQTSEDLVKEVKQVLTKSAILA